MSDIEYCPTCYQPMTFPHVHDHKLYVTREQRPPIKALTPEEIAERKAGMSTTDPVPST